MSNRYEYKGYSTEIQFSAEGQLLYGKIDGIADYVDFESASPTEIEQEFHRAVDDYLAFCQQMGKVPDKAYKGSFNVRISPDLHKRAVSCANLQHISLNKVVENALTAYIPSPNPGN